ncbi:HAMP domain-containing sensor histidine kinase [Microcoleus sp. FACHB-1515]|uniref:sensor histidine kinase n=1 Tax=Cyanophyceae TaxID=3028117 RepID=UPI0018F0039A|nr:HAMP domain-containing sensor histidine kinase [Microcoleus sp. FACHB-1515]
MQQRTQELEAEKQISETANQAKTEFLSYISHELRTPLASIISFSRILQQTFGTLNPKQQQYTEIIQSSGQYLLELINDLLDLSKIEANQEELALEIVSIEEVCQTVLSLVREQANARQLQLHCAIEPNLSVCMADKRCLKQILLNLLANAVSYTQDGSVTVRVTQSATAIDFAVIDTGIGISPSDQDLLFQPFQQVGSRDRSSGTGLGLALSRRLARLHGGESPANLR